MKAAAGFDLSHEGFVILTTLAAASLVLPQQAAAAGLPQQAAAAGLQQQAYRSRPTAAGLQQSGGSDSGGKIVHVVFSNHVDIGFDGIDPELGTDDNVINKYFEEFFPRAAATAKALEAEDSERYVWTTQAYLVSLFFDCPPSMGLQCPKREAKAAVEAAIRAGSISWHAFPHNAQQRKQIGLMDADLAESAIDVIELMDSDLVEFAIDMVHELDRNFGFPPKRTMSQRDVPGLTRAAVPVLVHPGWQIGLKGISVGVNGGSAPPAVPKQPFLWRDVASGAQIIAMWHGGGYSGEPVDSRDECMQVDGFDHVLCCAWRGDNAGPHSPDEVRDILRRVRATFPGARAQASTFDAFVEPLSAAVAAGTVTLPVFTQEIGDSWIHGVASDAGKLADFRALQRMRRKLSYDQSQDPAYRNLSRLLLKVPEHTWGADVKKAMPDYRNWSNADFHAALGAGSYSDAVHAWRRQRSYLDWALEALAGSKPGQGAAGLAAYLRHSAAAPDVNSPQFSRVHCATRFWSHAWDIQLHPKTGALASLRRRWRGQLSADWASPDSPLGQVTYSTYTEQDYDAIWSRYAYLPSLPEWFYKDFGKPNCSRFASPRRADSVATVEDAWARQQPNGGAGGFHAAVKLAFPAWAVAEAGAPRTAWLEYRSLPKSDALYLDVTWVDKTPTRLPEALWVAWRPVLQHIDPATWRLWKLDSAVDPADVAVNGSRSLHAVGDRGFHVDSADGRERLSIRPLDAPLVSPGEPTPFPNPNQQPDLRRGMHSLLANNIWGTNYVMWQPWRPEDSVRRFRFVIQVDDLSTAASESRRWGAQSAEQQ